MTNGIDVNIADSYGNIALHYAVWYSKTGITPLHKACFSTKRLAEILKLIYLDCQNVNVQDNNGETPLHFACKLGNRDVVEALMLGGADETIANDELKTPAQLAEETKHTELLELLDRNSLQQVISKRRNKGTLFS